MAYQHLLQNGLGYAFIIAGAGTGMAYMYPHTAGVKQYEEEMTTRTAGKPDMLDMEVQIAAEEIKREFQWAEHAEVTGSTLQLFPSKSADISHCGSMTTKWGAVLGVPAFYSSAFIQQAEENPALLAKYNIDPNTDEGKRTFDSLKLNENSKKFGLAREMCHAKSAQIYVNAFGLGLSVSGCYAVANSLSHILPFSGARFFSFLVSIPTVMFGSMQAYDWNNRSTQRRVDARAASLSEDTAKGGVDFYDSLIARAQLKTEATMTTPSNVKLSDPSEWFLDYRKRSLSNEERREVVIKAMRRLYDKNKPDDAGTV